MKRPGYMGRAGPRGPKRCTVKRSGIETIDNFDPCTGPANRTVMDLLEINNMGE